MSERREIYGVDYNNNTVDMYVLTESGKYDKVKTMEMVKLNETKEIEVYREDLSSIKITLDENTKVVQMNGLEVAYVLPNKVYALYVYENVLVELEQTAGIPESQKVSEKDGTLYDLVKSGKVNLGTVITGYEANGYSGEWMIYKLSGENVKILPYHDSWNKKYKYQVELGKNGNFDNIKNELEKYYNAELAVGGTAEMLTSAECKAEYSKNIQPISDFLRSEGYIYVLNDDGLVGWEYGQGGKEYELDTSVNYTIVPVITLDKDVKITAGEYVGRIYK